MILINDEKLCLKTLSKLNESLEIFKEDNTKNTIFIDGIYNPYTFIENTETKTIKYFKRLSLPSYIGMSIGNLTHTSASLHEVPIPNNKVITITFYIRYKYASKLID